LVSSLVRATNGRLEMYRRTEKRGSINSRVQHAIPPVTPSLPSVIWGAGRC
jgi:hypothetical protein